MGDSGLVVGDAHRFNPAAPEEELVYGSCSPGWHSACDTETALEQWLSFVRAEGIERVCCLLAGSEPELCESHLHRYREAFGEENVRHVPVAAYRLIDPATLEGHILPFLTESVERGSPTTVHCLSGVCRTGQVHAAWLVSHHGYEPERAIETVREMGRDPTELVDYGRATEEELLELLAAVRK